MSNGIEQTAAGFVRSGLFGGFNKSIEAIRFFKSSDAALLSGTLWLKAVTQTVNKTKGIKYRIDMHLRDTLILSFST